MDPKSSHFPDSFYRVGVKGLYVRDGKILLVRDEVDENESVWELPGGGMDFGETFEETLRREVKEEMGLRVTEVSRRPLYIWTYKIDKHRRMRGMEWYYVLLLTFRFEVENLNIISSKECRAVRFFSKEELMDLSDLNDQITPLRSLFNPADF